MNYDSRVESGAEAVRTGPGTCLIGKESEMYSKEKKKTVHNTHVRELVVKVTVAVDLMGEPPIVVVNKGIMEQGKVD